MMLRGTRPARNLRRALFAGASLLALATWWAGLTTSPVDPQPSSEAEPDAAGDAEELLPYRPWPRDETLLERLQRLELGARTRACLERRVPTPRRLGGFELLALTQELRASCFGRRGSWVQDDQQGALPFGYAIHESSGLPLELVYFCTDVCPTYGDVEAYFVDFSETECWARGGVPDCANGWEVYSGCGPIDLVVPPRLLDARSAACRLRPP